MSLSMKITYSNLNALRTEFSLSFYAWLIDSNVITGILKRVAVS